jgi:hypothetical protein
MGPVAGSTWASAMSAASEGPKPESDWSRTISSRMARMSAATSAVSGNVAAPGAISRSIASSGTAPFDGHQR